MERTGKLYIRPVGGLCNRIRSMDSVIKLADQNDLELIVIWVLCPNLNAKFSDLYKVDLLTNRNIKIIEIDPSKSIIQKFRAKVINLIETGKKGVLSQFLLKRVLKDNNVEIWFNNSDLSEMVNNTKEEGFQNAVDHELYLVKKLSSMLSKEKMTRKSVYIESCYRLTKLEDIYPYEIYSPERNIQKRIDNLVKKFDQTIGVHIRRTDHHYAIQKSPTQKFSEIIKNYLDQNKNNTVFLCTDDEGVRKEFRDQFGDKIILNEISSLRRDNPKGIEDAVVDLYGLSKTKKIYGSHFSSFSQMAADIGNIEMETVLVN